MTLLRSSIRRAGNAAGIVAIALVLASMAEARSIGVYFDAAGTICKGTIQPGTLGTVYVVMRFDDEEGGAAGAEFRFEGVPDSWATHPVANPTMLAIGDPMRNGIVAGFGECVGVTREPYVLYSILVIALEEETDVVFEAATRIPPTNRNFYCPIAIACDAPVFTAHCIRNVKCQVNSRWAGACAQPTAVTASSWSAVKGLYRGQ